MKKGCNVAVEDNIIIGLLTCGLTGMTACNAKFFP